MVVLVQRNEYRFSVFLSCCFREAINKFNYGFSNIGRRYFHLCLCEIQNVGWSLAWNLSPCYIYTKQKLAVTYKMTLIIMYLISQRKFHTTADHYTAVLLHKISL